MRAEALSAAHKSALRQGWARSRFSLEPQQHVRVAISELRQHHGHLLTGPLCRGAIRAAVEAIAAGVDPRSPKGRAISHV